jgi:hypothetical protein
VQEFDPITQQQSADVRAAFSRKLQRDQSADSAAIRHAPQHITDTDMWGVSDPAERPRGRGCEAGAGSLTPHFCSDSCAGALTGRQKTPPDGDHGAPAKGLTCMHLTGASSLRGVIMDGEPTLTQRGVRGANRALR